MDIDTDWAIYLVNSIVILVQWRCLIFWHFTLLSSLKNNAMIAIFWDLAMLGTDYNNVDAVRPDFSLQLCCAGLMPNFMFGICFSYSKCGLSDEFEY